MEFWLDIASFIYRVYELIRDILLGLLICIIPLVLIVWLIN